MSVTERHRGAVPPSQTLERGTVGQTKIERDGPRDTCGTVDLKALALRLNERDRLWDRSGTARKKPVPRADRQWDTLPRGVPVEWSAGVERLASASSLPRGMRAHNWPLLVEDCRRFANDWGAIAAEKGWTVTEVFGVVRSLNARCQPTSQVGRIVGLALMLNGGEVEDLTDARAVIRTCNDAALTFPRWLIAGAVSVWTLIR